MSKTDLLEADIIEDQLVEAFDQLTAKSAKTRLAALDTLHKALSERYMIEFIFNRKITILDSLSRLMKRSGSRGPDLGYAASLISIVCSTIGPCPETDLVFSELVSQLHAFLTDQTIKPDIKSKCAQTIGICTFIIGINGYQRQMMDRLFTIFSASCAKGDKTMPNPSEQIAALHSSCIQSWTLLLTAVNSSSPHDALEIVEEYMDKMTELLDSPHLDVKLCAGETLAIMYEIIRSQNEDITAEDFVELCDKIRELVNDAQKFRGKKDLRQQRSNFREILSTIEEDEAPNLTIKFGRERLELGSWSRRRHYDAFCDVFGTGMNLHLAENEVIRGIFGLGAVLIHLDLPRVKRSDNSAQNAVVHKIRTKNMRKLRDKRIDLVDEPIDSNGLS